MNDGDYGNRGVPRFVCIPHHTSLVNNQPKELVAMEMSRCSVTVLGYTVWDQNLISTFQKNQPPPSV
jgi:hypothetical protein